jgi:hypothetical protein
MGTESGGGALHEKNKIFLFFFIFMFALLPPLRYFTWFVLTSC